jgi:glycogen synthase
MKVCFICVEIFAWGKYGGFGRATRIICRELVKRGIEVFAVVPRRKGQKPVEELDGITVLSFPSYFPWSARELYIEYVMLIFIILKSLPLGLTSL